MKVIYFTILSILSLSSSAYAYVDPATGGALTTALLGIIAALALGAKTIYYRIVNFLRMILGIGSNKDENDKLN